jgi:AcrR family transcriptional regulator
MRWPPDIEPLPRPVADETWEKLRQATMDLAIERGYYAFDVSDIIERAGVSRAEFDARFTGKRDCCDRTYEANNADFDQAFVGPYLQAPSWREGLRAGAYGAVEFLRHARRERRFGEVRMREGGLMEQAKRDFYLQRFVDLIDVGRCEMSNPDAVNRNVAVGVLGSIYGLLVRRLEKTGEEGIGIEIIDDLMYLAVRPYLGQAVALEELSTPAPPSVA